MMEENEIFIKQNEDLIECFTIVEIKVERLKHKVDTKRESKEALCCVGLICVYLEDFFNFYIKGDHTVNEDMILSTTKNDVTPFDDVHQGIDKDNRP
ncbi:hypothetical protein PVK06_020611 [Gossypium arboreum]|uniref:Uncharacterized protein n=1 Tax=Gossypium arboreum TaxID=29729 RepID=A0ABR0PMU1_GOSAR|nr:hypothetical protein PVK06_020611 [Gossypium arboreum]